MGASGGTSRAQRYLVDFYAVGHGSKLCECQRPFQRGETEYTQASH
jgi:hypothetical protein